MKLNFVVLIACLSVCAFLAHGHDLQPPRPGYDGHGNRPGARTLGCSSEADGTGLRCTATNQKSAIVFDFETYGFPRCALHWRCSHVSYCHCVDFHFLFLNFCFWIGLMSSFRAFFFNRTSGIADDARVSASSASFRVGFYDVFEFADDSANGYQNETRLQ